MSDNIQKNIVYKCNDGHKRKVTKVGEDYVQFILSNGQIEDSRLTMEHFLSLKPKAQ